MKYESVVDISGAEIECCSMGDGDEILKEMEKDCVPCVVLYFWGRRIFFQFFGVYLYFTSNLKTHYTAEKKSPSPDT